jgi:glycogen(starch) synthase
MKILIYSPSFYPNIGGVETIISALAHEFIHVGHEVKLISQTPAPDNNEFPFEIIRKPSINIFFKLMYWCDIYFQACVSLKGIYPLFFIHRPLVITHQTWYCQKDGRASWQGHVKLFVTRFATNISASHAIAKMLPVKSTVIPNSYRGDIFCEIPEISRNRELVYLGRLIPDKGVSILLEALSKLKLSGLTPSLTIIGTGPEESNLIEQAKYLEIKDQVTFAGAKIKRELSELLNVHKIMVVPSLWDEPFGIVALEGIACGCVVIGSEGGGLKDAIGDCGVTFPNGDAVQLANIIFDLLTHPEKLNTYRIKSQVHLERHTSKFISKSYLDVFKQLLKNR